MPSSDLLDTTSFPATSFEAFHRGDDHLAHSRFGALVLPGDGVQFTVWAPTARRVELIGDTRGWEQGIELGRVDDAHGVFRGVIPDAAPGHRYKYRITSAEGWVIDKADPYAFATEMPPLTASVVADLSTIDDVWTDDAWMSTRDDRQRHDRPISIYEVHLGSFLQRRHDGSFPGYRDLAVALADHVVAHGFTHVELMPVTEHPFTGSWGYQTTGYFAPTARFGRPDDFARLVDHLHGRGIGVILDWVPSHFPADGWALARFDGHPVYEHPDPRLGHQPDWDSCVFDYGRPEVRSFLISSAVHLCRTYHLDGLRVDAVASMLYRDYSRGPGQWLPNDQGGREHWEAVHLLRTMNATLSREVPGVQTFAEESTAWPNVSRPLEDGGLGFGFKWDMGWMHDTLEWFRKDPIHRRYHQHDLTFRSLYATTEHFVLSLSHDEVVHGKGSLLAKMPGDDWQRRANLRLLFGLQWTTPGKKLLFMGGEMGMSCEWDHDAHLPWHEYDDPGHRGIATWVRELNSLLRREPALYEADADAGGFEWVDANDAERSILSFLRWDRERRSPVLVVMNGTPVPRHNIRIGVPWFGRWAELLNSDAHDHGGSGVGNAGGADAAPVPAHGRPVSLVLTLPPLGLLVLAPAR